MPVRPTYPGVYIEEVPSGIRTITGVATSVTGFIGRARRGPPDEVSLIHSFADYERIYGGLWEDSSMSYAVFQYFQNGGSDALIVRVHNGALASSMTFPGEGGGTNMVLEAASPGAWGDQLRGRADHDTRELLPGEAVDSLFNLSISDLGTGRTETHRNLSVQAGHPSFVTNVLAEKSDLVRLTSIGAVRPEITPPPDPGATPFEDSADGLALSNAVAAAPGSGANGAPVGDTEIIGSGVGPKTGLFAFDAADIINLLCVPPFVPDGDGNVLNGEITPGARTAALDYALSRRAMFLVDPSFGWTESADPLDPAAGIDSAAFGMSRNANAAIYFPRLLATDRLQEGRISSFVPCGAIAGLIARTDAERGVWKAPAGIESTLRGVTDLTVRLTDDENGQLNPQGINCLRIFKGVGRISWGARTMRGADLLADEWKYLPVRRTALFIEETLFRGTKWVVFEPNDEPLWAQIRLNVGAFMMSLFRQGAFQGTSPDQAFYVKCDKETTTQADINNGIVNIEVGFAPLKPAEFVIIKIQQIAGEL